MGRKSKDIIGKTYGKLTVIGLDHKVKSREYYKCRCECGNEKVFIKANITSGRTKSCGCIRKANKDVDTIITRAIADIQAKAEPKKPNIAITQENYFSPTVNMAYLDCTTYKNFVGTPGIKSCEARALAEARGEIEHPVSTALMVGSYVDAYFSNELDQFKAEHPEIISSRGATAGQLKTEYQQANIMIERAIREPLFMKFMEGDTQRIFTGEIEGVPVRCKVDSIDGKRITDLKTVQSLSKTYYASDLNERLDFITNFGYTTQLAMYREIVRQNTGELLPCYIAAISKDKTDNVPHPRVAVIQIPEPIMDDEIIKIKHEITKVWDIMQGNMDPICCGVCDFCADTLPLERIITPDELLTEV